VVAEVAGGDHPEGANGRERAALGLAQCVVPVPVVDARTLVGARQIDLAHEEVARVARLSVSPIESARLVVSISTVVPARIIKHGDALQRPLAAACDHFGRLISDNRHDVHHLAVVFV